MNLKGLGISFCYFFLSHHFFSPLKGQDTTFSEVIDLPFTVRSMVNDAKGNIFLETSVGLFQYDGSKYWEIDKNYNKGALAIRNGKLTNISDVIKKEGIFISDWKKNQVWLKFLPANSNNLISLAKDKKGISWVASGNKLYRVEIKKIFVNLLEGISTRNILWINSNMYVSTYSGIFRNEKRVFSEILISEGLTFDSVTRDIYFTSQRDIFRYSLVNKKLLKFNFEKEVPDYGLILNLKFYKGKKWVVASSGLFDFEQPEKYKTKIKINDTHIIGDTLFISSVDGIYTFDGNLISKANYLPSIETNSISKIGEIFWVATKQGVYIYSAENKKAEKIILNQTFPDLETYAVLKDNNGYYWISTAAGLYRYNKFNGRINVFFQGLEFNKRSYLSHNGIFYFGSINGLISFNPLDFSEDFKEEADSNNLVLFMVITILFLIVGTLFLLRFKPAKKVDLQKNIIFKDEKDEFIYGLGAFILENLNYVSVDDLIVFSEMKKRSFYRKLESDFNLTPNQLIQKIKEKKARRLLAENPGIQLDIVAKNTGFSMSNLYLILKEEDTDFTGNLEVLNLLQY
jgi:AraC-like DNA-binding protein